MTENRELELYFHIPFCVRKCLYCDFLSAPADEEVRRQYMDALMREVRGRAEEYQGYLVTSAFIGGGTPSVVDVRQIEELMATVQACYEVASDAELTIEVNPGTVDFGKLKIYRRAGINRLSIGLQSADDKELAVLGRIHSLQQFLDTYRDAREAGFDNINVDVMSALPGQNLESYQKTLQKITTLCPVPEHISAYSLILEEGTALFRQVKQGMIKLPDEEADREMYRDTKRILEQAGYRRYEISNYAKEGFACRHNIGYWKRQNYLGFGIGAASLINNMRFNNGSNIEIYLRDPLNYQMEVQRLSFQEQMEEFMFLGLRLTEGVSALRFQKQFGQSLQEVYGSVIAQNEKEGLLQRYIRSVGGVQEEMLALTDFGLDVSNYVMSQFLI